MSISLECPLTRTYSDVHDFSREYVDIFYDLVERLHQLVFVDCINPYTKKPYMVNAQIIQCIFDPHLYDSGNNDSYNDCMGYFFKVSYDVIQEREYLSTNHNNTHRRVIPCVIDISLHFIPGEPNSYLCLVDSTFPDNVSNHLDVELNSLQYPFEENFYIPNTKMNGKNFVDIFEICLTISKNDKCFDHISSEYIYKINAYLKALRDHHHFLEVQFPAFANVMIKGKAPSHEEKPFLAQAASEPLVLKMIRDQEMDSFFSDLMRKLFKYGL